MKNSVGKALSDAVLWVGLALIVTLAVPTAVLIGVISAIWSGADRLAKVFDKDSL